jgi:hypothetical protein
VTKEKLAAVLEAFVCDEYKHCGLDGYISGPREGYCEGAIAFVESLAGRLGLGILTMGPVTTQAQDAAANERDAAVFLEDEPLKPVPR